MNEIKYLVFEMYNFGSSNQIMSKSIMSFDELSKAREYAKQKADELANVDSHFWVWVQRLTLENEYDVIYGQTLEPIESYGLKFGQIQL